MTGLGLFGVRGHGIADLVGSIEVGKRADIVIHAYRRPRGTLAWTPSTTSSTARSSGVDTVLVDGEKLICRGEFTRDDDKAEFRYIGASARALYKRMGFDLRHRWNLVG